MCGNFLAAAASVSRQVAFKLSLIESSSVLWLSFPRCWRAPARRRFHARAIWRSLLAMASRMPASILPRCLLPVANGWAHRAQGPGPPEEPSLGTLRQIVIGHTKTLWPYAGRLGVKEEVVMSYLFTLSPWQNCVWKAVIPLPCHFWHIEMGTSKACGWEHPWALSRDFWGMWTWIQMWNTQMARVLGAGQTQTTDLYHTSPLLGPAELNPSFTAWDICSWVVTMNTRNRFGLLSLLGSKRQSSTQKSAWAASDLQRMQTREARCWEVTIALTVEYYALQITTKYVPQKKKKEKHKHVRPPSQFCKCFHPPCSFSVFHKALLPFVLSPWPWFPSRWRLGKIWFHKAGKPWCTPKFIY